MAKEKKPKPSNVRIESKVPEKDDDLGFSSEEEEIERVLGDIPLGELQKARADGSHASLSKTVVRDPRFESLCGTLDTEGFHKRYDFLFEVELPAEKEKLQKLIKKEKDPNVVKELKDHVHWIAAGKLDSFVEKRRKRNALKDIRYMPYRKSSKEAQYLCPLGSRKESKLQIVSQQTVG
ncbi:hypothetical protein J5N97_025244 [Dioscorea zingiberensis]|uniref:rRNA biogenesis protein RRP36 n=1 Tax=Dioscorea zingiberensis TaxID=325984 RepID=A0A9D5H9N0_9LILI|nr:hypothetical protein J5N97_025244 [Dioscorea zingiberensis]